MSFHHGFREVADAEMMRVHMILDDASNANFTMASKHHGHSGGAGCLCQNELGWGPFDPKFALTPCFIDGVVLNIPSALLILLGTFQLIKLWRRKRIPCKQDWRLYTKLGLVAAQIVLFAAIAFTATAFHKWQSNIAFWTPVINFAALFIGLGIHYLENSRSFISNGVLLFYWLFSPLCLAVKVSELHNDNAFQHYKNHSILYTVALFNGVLILLLEWLLPKAASPYESLLRTTEKNPIEFADIFSRITFSWMTPLMRRGYETYLTEEDLPELPSSDTTSRVTDKFQHYWDIQVNTKSSPSLAIPLAQAFGGPFFVAAVFKATQDVLAFVQPQLLRLLIKFVYEYNDAPKGEVPLSKGFLIAGSMFAVSILQTASLHQYFQRAFETGMRFKASLTSAVFNKALIMSNEDRAGKSTGDIVNLMSVDTQRLQDLTQYGQILWSGPFQIVLCLGSLYTILGHSMWAGVAVMLIMIPINTWLARVQKKLQQKQMKNKDQRTKLTSEILTNVKSLKLYGWEEPFMARLNHVRNNLELKTLKTIGLYSAFGQFLWNCAPFLVSCSTFALFVLTQDKALTTDMVFPALTLFNLLSFPLSVIPNVVTALVEASVSTARLRNFLQGEELQSDAVERLPRANEIGEESINITNGTFLWERRPEYKIALGNINFTARKGELSCIVGRVGCGKSSFLQAILGELYKAQGSVTVKGRVAYASQVPWIMNGSVKDNILFGSKYEEGFYERTIDACALRDDLDILPDGDGTLVGEKGISLSGGQKARISLARAVYARADVYLLDDPLSAVDEHVGRHIIDNVLGADGLLASKCIVLATNSIPVLSHADTITMLANGKITETGTLEEARQKQTAIYSLLTDFGKRSTGRNNESEASSVTAHEELAESSSTLSSNGSGDNEVAILASDAGPTALEKKRKRRQSDHILRRASTASYTKPTVMDDEQRQKMDKFKEHSEQGQVKWNVYKEYARASNIYGVFVFLAALVISMALSVGGNVWLKHWSEVNSEAGKNPHVGKYLGIYAAFGISGSLFTAVQAVILTIYCAIWSARILHERMLKSVLRAPMSFFETTPIGRILNRFSNDIYRVDQLLPRTFSQFFANAVKVMFTMIVISFSTPAFILVMIPLGVLYLWYQRYYLRTSRELKRLDSVSRSPIYAHFQETLGGMSTVRAYSQQNRFTFMNESRVDLNLKAYFPTVSANRWLAVRLEFIGSVIILSAAGMAIALLPGGGVTAGIVGLALSYALQITQSLNWIVRMTVEVETNIVSVERILEYSGLPSEAPAVIENHRPPAVWPTSGAIGFDNYSTRYRPELPLVLKNISMSVNPQEKVGIVGRTGAGKSSLTLALFRIIEAAEGDIKIDDLRTDSIGLKDLRQRLSIIPQDSQVFEGTIRDNLDPEGHHDDTELWRALELSHLKGHVQSMSGGLDGRVNEGGSNLSVGQRQLMCLARALLTPSKVLVLDEATAAVDVETDQVLQETIRSEFKDRTILTIAHRLNTILDSDRIVVLDQGQVAEFDSPEVLLNNKDSMFYALAKRGGFIDE
uniref:ARAD1D22132p n=1 Tax=Blastobotrys adeninivorans TaxID=409370 RepID=A0A060TAR9_BLAAD